MADISATAAIVPQAVLDAIAKAQSDATAAMTQANNGLTSANRQQALRVQVTPDANGRVTFTYPQAYVAGTVPAVSTTAETPNGAAYRNDASVEEGTATATQVVILVQRIPKSLTVSILGAVLNVIAPVTTPVWINVFIRAPV
jgi:hypothetical protein